MISLMKEIQSLLVHDLWTFQVNSSVSHFHRAREKNSKQTKSSSSSTIYDSNWIYDGLHAQLRACR